MANVAKKYIILATHRRLSVSLHADVRNVSSKKEASRVLKELLPEFIIRNVHVEYAQKPQVEG